MMGSNPAPQLLECGAEVISTVALYLYISKHSYNSQKPGLLKTLGRLSDIDTSTII